MTEATRFTNLKSDEAITAATAVITGAATVGGTLAVTGAITATGGVGATALTDPRLNFTIGEHSYASAHADWTLSAAELLKMVHKPTAADQAVNAIIPAAAGKPYIFINATGQALTVKTPAGTGVAITSAKTAIVMSDGTNVIALCTESA